MNNIKTYLAGCMLKHLLDGQYEKATEWRKYATEKLADAGIKVFDPTINSIEQFRFPKEYINGVILQNYTYLKKCDMLLLNLDSFEDSIGSIGEITLAWEHKKPVIAFGKCLKWTNSPHFQSMITLTLPDVESACDYIILMYNQKV